MFKTLAATIKIDKDYPERQNRIDILTRVLKGKLYDGLEYPFSQERVEIVGEYIPMQKRRPSVRYSLCRTIVNDSVSLLFSEGHFPSVACGDETTRDTLSKIIKESKINQLMIKAATIGSVGSVAILMRVLSNRLFFSAMNTMYLTPKWKPQEPDTLESVTEQYKVDGAILIAQGYSNIDEKKKYWFKRVWDSRAETWYLPYEVGSKEEPSIDKDNTVTHGLEFVPMVWIKNLPSDDAIDGSATFPDEVIDTQIEIEYQLSQAGRGLKYTSSPTLALKDDALEAGKKHVVGDALIIPTDGDAKLLEISGDAVAAVIEYSRFLRELALEVAQGNRSNADKLSAAQSGRAMELMNQSLIWLADKLRISYGEDGLLQLLNMIVAASQKIAILVNKKSIEPLSCDEELSLRWPAWYAPTYSDKQVQAGTLTTLRNGDLISQETAVTTIAPTYDIQDPADELKRIKSEEPDEDEPVEPQKSDLPVEKEE